MSTNLIQQVIGTRITLGSAGTETAALTMANLSNGSLRQSAKFDLGATQYPEYNVTLMAEYGSAPSAGGYVQVWIGYSSSATAATENVGGCSGADAAYSNDYTYQMDLIGVMPLAAITTSQTAIVGSFRPRNRYAYIVLKNAAGQAMANSSSVHQLRLDPVGPRVEAAA